MMNLSRQCKRLLMWLPLALATVPACKDLQAERIGHASTQAAPRVAAASAAQPLSAVELGASTRSRVMWR